MPSESEQKEPATETSQADDNQNLHKKSFMRPFLTLLFLIISIIGACLLFRENLFLLLDRYSKNFGTFVIYSGFVGISLVSAVVLFGILRSSGIFKKKGQYEFGGAMAGFMATLMFLIGTYAYQAADQSVIIVGNTRFVANGKPVGPVDGATIALSKLPGYETETDKNGNFSLELPDKQQTNEIEFLIKHEGKAYYQTVQRSMLQNVKIEIEKTDPTSDISGKWLYRSESGNKIWRIDQYGSKLTITDEDSQNSFNGRYIKKTGDISFFFEITMTDGPPVISEGRGKIDGRGEKITGHMNNGKGFILERILE